MNPSVISTVRSLAKRRSEPTVLRRSPYVSSSAVVKSMRYMIG